ncbi:uncharacterized protein LOC116263187 [Nymphaea colorata]|nr:uncharacterized protein LOC116263187 [Nymphaea colorata]XP_049936275.1 uncharacterized protein LOC116263187 [Nymphaea colorata]XP_049936276.1 uncharacterized protein LOC116263187 [Nymphaea colorata]XP_049936277.1 uncharacterized protein LOC116263187 [Nymphaea colorata]
MEDEGGDAFGVPAALLQEGVGEEEGDTRRFISEMVVFQGEGQEEEEEDEEEEVEDEQSVKDPVAASAADVAGGSGAADCSSGSSMNENDMDSDVPDEDAGTLGKALTLNPPRLVNPQPHISTQFFTFNRESHSLMVRCIVDRRLATPEEIRTATPQSVLASWRGVWKDRNEGTAYITGWKRIQEKLNAHIDEQGIEFLYFKNNPQQYVSHVDQWQDIVMSFHGDADFKHLGLKETIERIKQVWTVGAKFYGIPESFIRVCIGSCPVCSDAGSNSAARSKRRRFEYTESFEVPAKEVPWRLQQLAAKHKVVLCIRQKYIRYKPFMAEVKDYACHRAGEPNPKRSRVLKREPYASKRCGCGFRIRAIVPITNYNEKEKSFVYQEEGMAVFKLYAVHSGHEPGPLDGSARIFHRVVGMKDENMGFFGATTGGHDSDTSGSHISVLQQVQDLQVEIGALQLAKMPEELLHSLSQDLSAIINRLRSIREDEVGLLIGKQNPEQVLVGDHHSGFGGEWEDHHRHSQIHADGDLIEGEDDEAFEQSLENVAQWDALRAECRSKDILRENCKSDKWLDSVKEACHEFDGKSILVCEDTKLVKPIRHEGPMVVDSSLIGIQVDGFYSDNSKWYDSPCPLDPGSDCGDGSFRDGIM